MIHLVINRYQEVSMRPRNVLSEMLLEQEWITPLRQILAELDYVKLISYRLQVSF